MQDHPLRDVCATLVCSMAFLVSNTSVWAAQPEHGNYFGDGGPAGGAAQPEHGNYFEASVGFTRPPKVDGIADPGTDMALGVAYGTSLSENTRSEIEFAYAKVAWDFGSGVDVTADGFNVGANFLYDIGAASSPAKFEIGFGFGWTFFDEACIESNGNRLCVDADLDDWNVQGILGGSYSLSETNAIVVRYRMQNIGGFSSEDRLHVFTVGYRHLF